MNNTFRLHSEPDDTWTMKAYTLKNGIHVIRVEDAPDDASDGGTAFVCQFPAHMNKKQVSALFDAIVADAAEATEYTFDDGDVWVPFDYAAWLLLCTFPTYAPKLLNKCHVEEFIYSDAYKLMCKYDDGFEDAFEDFRQRWNDEPDDQYDDILTFQK